MSVVSESIIKIANAIKTRERARVKPFLYGSK